VADLGGVMSACYTEGPVVRARAMDDHIMRCGIISSWHYFAAHSLSILYKKRPIRKIRSILHATTISADKTGRFYRSYDIGLNAALLTASK